MPIHLRYSFLLFEVSYYRKNILILAGSEDGDKSEAVLIGRYRPRHDLHPCAAQRASMAHGGGKRSEGSLVIIPLPGFP